MEIDRRLHHKAVSLKQANEFVQSLHRHHKKVQGHKFSIGAYNSEDKLVGVVIVGRPVARMLDDGRTVEVTRLCTDGTFNACSFLYGAAAKAAKELGYSSIITYILSEEPGTSLKGAGWICEGEFGGGTWNRPNRERTDKAPITPKHRYRKLLIKQTENYGKSESAT